jgi:ABC-type dipeptide transport system, periplasmic component
MPGLVVKDDQTVTVTLATADPIFDQKIATALIPPVKISQAVDESGAQKADWWRPENGVVVSGPFMPESMDLDQGIVTMVPNPNFFGPKPKLEKIVISTVSDPITATLMLQRGDMDAATELITPTIIQDLGADFLGGPALAKGQQFWFDASKPPMDDINVPQGPDHGRQPRGAGARRLPRRAVHGRRPDPQQGAGRRSGLSRSTPSIRKAPRQRSQLQVQGFRSPAEDHVRRHLDADARGCRSVHRRAVAQDPGHPGHRE